jgi:hypothetical protein
MPLDNQFIIPEGMRRAQAATHVGISAAHFDKLVIDGLMPSPRIAAGVKIWLRSELEYALLELEQDQRGSVQCQSEYTLNI